LDRLLERLSERWQKRGLAPEEIAKRLDEARRRFRADIEEKRALLNKKYVPPWEIGIPVEQAEKWVREYYGIAEGGQ
jgi:hypothetical protein